MIEYDSKRLSPDYLCRSKFEVITRLHDYMTTNDFLIDMDFADYFPYLTICQPTKTYELAPPILMLGNLSDQKRLFETHFGDDAFPAGRTPDANLERLSAAGYEDAVENGTFCQECEATVVFPDGPKFVPFLRYMVHYRDPGGRSLIAYAATLLDRTWQ
ncbi:MAG: hypothetical protein QNJ29_12660 [Rhizobiaceae bacterium]|nr:hypothetical protein [Rhizobiaceae bacterium]